MTQYFNLLQRVLDATNRGLDIITDLLPAVDEFIKKVDVEGRKMIIRLIPGMVDEE